MKTALITGASNGIGRALAYAFAERGYRLILVARSKERLTQVARELKTRVRIVAMDLSDEANCYRLHEMTKGVSIDVVVNNAGFGYFGEFTETELKSELNMLDLNCRAVHILTKLYVKDFAAVNRGCVVNVASVAAFAEGPLMATYYATKAYVVKLTNAIRAELKKSGSKVRICSVCPGPVDTGFNDRAGVRFSIGQITAEQVAECTIDGIERNRGIILPDINSKLIYMFSRLIPTELLSDICYNVQSAKK
jgi:hypothetical protein